MFSVRFQQLLCHHCEEFHAIAGEVHAHCLSMHDLYACDKTLETLDWYLTIDKLPNENHYHWFFVLYYLNGIMSPNLHFCKSSHGGHDGHDAPPSSSMMVTILLLFCPSCILGEVVTIWSSTANDSGNSNSWSFWIETVTVCIKVSGLNITSLETAV